MTPTAAEMPETVLSFCQNLRKTHQNCKKFLKNKKEKRVKIALLVRQISVSPLDHRKSNLAIPIVKDSHARPIFHGLLLFCVSPF
jgi:hypothetical protein